MHQGPLLTGPPHQGRMCRGSGFEFCDKIGRIPNASLRVPMMKSSIFNVPECCGGRARPVRQIETQGFVGKAEQLHDKLLSGQRSSLQNMKFNAAGPNGARLRNHQGASGALSVERAPIRPDTALAAWMFFFWRWAPPKLTRELPGGFLWPFLPSPSLFSQKELIDTDIDTPSPVTISPPCP